MTSRLFQSAWILVAVVCRQSTCLLSPAAAQEEQNPAQPDAAAAQQNAPAQPADAAGGAPPAAVADNDYQIGAGDTLQVFVWRQPDLSVTVPVRPDGRISTPLIEDVVAVGKTPTQLAHEIEQKLSEYVRSPQVNIIVQKFVGTFSGQVRVLGQAAQAKSVDDLAVPGQIGPLQVRQQPATPTHHGQQPAAAVVIVLVCLEVIREFVDSACQNCNLNFRATGVARLGAEFGDDCLLSSRIQ